MRDQSLVCWSANNYPLTTVSQALGWARGYSGEQDKSHPSVCLYSGVGEGKQTKIPQTQTHSYTPRQTCRWSQVSRKPREQWVRTILQVFPFLSGEVSGHLMMGSLGLSRVGGKEPWGYLPSLVPAHPVLAQGAELGSVILCGTAWWGAPSARKIPRVRAGKSEPYSSLGG